MSIFLEYPDVKPSIHNAEILPSLIQLPRPSLKWKNEDEICYQDEKLDISHHFIMPNNSNQSPNGKHYQCKRCDYTTSDKNELKYHFLKHKENTRIFKCESCPFVTRHLNVIENHKVLHLKPEDIVWHNCEFCTFRSKLKDNLWKHRLIHTISEEMKK